MRLWLLHSFPCCWRIAVTIKRGMTLESPFHESSETRLDSSLGKRKQKKTKKRAEVFVKCEKNDPGSERSRKCEKEWRKTKKARRKLTSLLFYYHFPDVHKGKKRNWVARRRQVFLIKAVAAELRVHFNRPAITSHHVHEVQWGWQVNQRQGREAQKNTCVKTAQAEEEKASEWHNCQFQSHLAPHVVLASKQNPCGCVSFSPHCTWQNSCFCSQASFVRLGSESHCVYD